MIWPFKCNHPIGKLVVQSKETHERIDEDFTHTTYYFRCSGCGKMVITKYASLNGGVREYLKRKPRDALKAEI